LAGILLFYPVPALRLIPIRLATRLAELAVVRKRVVFGYVIGAFVIVPLVGVLAF
ncbi:MAG: sodium dependent phosphate transporter, partial [Actinobacteria bacterium]|nr:sodium dependent phosphate transporter [Actinomycetota bacterium]NIX23504.1 sodium dependent phosphate transporter [Actinomycetota bacterium]